MSQKQKSKTYYMSGKHSVLKALENPARIVEKVLCTKDFAKENADSLKGRHFELTTSEALNKVLASDANHQGVAAQVRTIFKNDFDDLELFNKSKCKIAVLDQVTDPQNVGAIIRSAVAFGMDAIVMPFDSSPEENNSIAKAASGTLEMIQIVKVTNLRHTLEFMKKYGFWITGLDGHSKTPLTHSVVSDKMAIVLGSEGSGLRRLTKETCDHLVQIPISNVVESLNVSTAAAIAFFVISEV